ncbi:MAG: hypothetical protein KDB88_00485 [Flavobacteriales bacterium]|nr:hypothetical protein [Flavobacteriales bacterium]
MMNRLGRNWSALAVSLCAFFGSWMWLRVEPSEKGVSIVIELRTDHAGEHLLFYDGSGEGYHVDRSVTCESRPSAEVQRLTFELPPGMNSLRGIRYDPGKEALSHELHAIHIRGRYSTLTWSAEDIRGLFSAVNDMEPFPALEDDKEGRSGSREPSKDSHILLECTGNDPYMASAKDLDPMTRSVMDPVRPVIGPFAYALVIAFLAYLGVIAFLRWRSQAHGTISKPASIRRLAAPRLGTLLIALVIGALTMGLLHNVSFQERQIFVDLELIATESDNFQLFFARKPGDFKEGNYVNRPVRGSDRVQLVRFRMPLDTLFSHLRFDPGNMQDSLLLKAMHLRCNDEVRSFGPDELYEMFDPNEQITRFTLREDGVSMVFKDNDPFLFCDDNLGPEVKYVWESSGNGPLPFLFGTIAFLFTLFANWDRQVSHATDGAVRNNEWAMAIVFSALLSMPLLAEFLPIQPLLADTEKRPLAERPLLRMHSLLNYPDRYTRYFADHFGFRKALFRANALFHAYVIKDSSMPDNVVFGKDGFLFLMRPGVIDQYRGASLLSEQELTWIGERLEKRRRWLAERGISYYLYFPPLKASVYPDKLPGPFRPVRTRSALDELIDHLRATTSIPVIDSRSTLIAGRSVRDTYYTTDMHWNPWGAYLGYKDLMGRIVGDHPELGSVCLEEDFAVEAHENENGDLAMQIAMNDHLRRVTYMMVPKHGVRAEETAEEDLPASAFFKYKPVFMRGPDLEAPKLLMFRDSFTVYLIPYLSEHFSRSVYVWSPVFIPDIVEKEKPDVVVQEMLELFITDLLEDKLHEDI